MKLIFWTIVFTTTFLKCSTLTQIEDKGKPCSFSETVNITDGVLKDGTIEFDGFSYKPENYAEYDYIMINKTHGEYSENHLRGCKCKITNCIRFCSKPRKFVNLPYKSSSWDPVDLEENNFHAITGKPCNATEMFNFTPEKGSIQLNKDGSLTLGEVNYDNSKYCLVTKKNISNVAVCPNTSEPNLVKYVYSTGMMISVIFLIATLIVYMLLPALRNFQGWNIMCYIVCLAFYYLSMSVALGFDIGHDIFCSTVGYSAYCFGLATFFWLNLMCIEIFTKVVVKPYQTSRRSADDIQQFIVFCTYGFGVPFLITIFIYLMDHTSIGSFIEDKYRPKIGLKQEGGATQCFVQSQFWSQQKYFHSILIFITIINLILFTWIIITISKIKAAVARNSDSLALKKNTESLVLYIKLFILMGIFWIMEPLSSLLVKYQNYFIFFDILNGLHGLIIFIILVIKRKVLRLLMKRIKCQPDSNQASSSTNKTRSIEMRQESKDANS